MENTETAIFDRIVDTKDFVLPPEAAAYVLHLDFRPTDVDRINELSELARDGTLVPDERGELENFNRVSHLLALLQSKARQSLTLRAD